MMLIGIDHGNKQMKTVHCKPFVSGLQQSTTKPFGKDVLKYRDTYYTLSGQRIPYRKDKTDDDRFFILTLFALAGELEARGCPAEEVVRVRLAVGLPPAYFGAQAVNFVEYFKGRDIVSFSVNGKAYEVYIEDVACFPQAYAAAQSCSVGRLRHPEVGTPLFVDDINANAKGYEYLYQIEMGR